MELKIIHLAGNNNVSYKSVLKYQKKKEDQLSYRMVNPAIMHHCERINLINQGIFSIEIGKYKILINSSLQIQDV